MSKLDLTLCILSWKSHKTLNNTLSSYKKNGLLELSNQRLIFFQEISEEDKTIATGYDLDFLGSKNNIGIGKAFSELVNNAKSDYILLLENDWELVEDISNVYKIISDSISFLKNDIADVVRLRHRKNYGHPLWSKTAFEGNELNGLTHILESIHWIEDPHLRFPDYIKKIKGEPDWFRSFSKNASFSNSPSLYKKTWFMQNLFNFFYESNNLWLEIDIREWWQNQNFKVVMGPGLFKHNDLDKTFLNIRGLIWSISRSTKKLLHA